MSRPKSVFDSLPRSWRIFRYLAPRMRGEWKAIAAGLAALFTGVAFRIFEPWPLKYVLDRIVAQQLPGQLAPESGDTLTLLTIAAFAIVLITAARAFFEYRQTIGFALVGNRIITQLRSDLFGHMQNLSLDFHNSSRKGDLTIRVISDVNMLKEVVISALLPLASSLLILLGMASVMLWMHWKLALIAIGTFPVFWLFAARSGRKIHDASRRQRRREGALAATASESMSAQQAVQSLSLQNVFHTAFASQNNKSQKEGVRTSRLTAGLERTVDVMIATASAAVLWQGGRYALSGELSPGELVVFLTYLKRGFKPLQDFAKYTGRLSKATAAGERVIELLDTEPSVCDYPDAVQAPAVQGHVQLENVSFGYDTESVVLRRLNLDIPPGHHVALVGPSGIGKSTVLSLLMRLYDPKAGRVLIDGADIRSWTLQSLRSQISIVLQDNMLFAASIRDNIRYANPAATDDDVEAAARIASAHDFIQQLPDGYDTQLGERGVNLSHGQRQRIAIARAAIRRSPILLLDEPTTGLDEHNEQAVIESLLRVRAGRTTFTVTHNLRFASKADLVVFLSDGQISECGTHAELLHSNGQYARMFRRQVAVHSSDPVVAT
ncbi:MAG: ABC transporter ATP-binding protein [Planctomycetaceae bacterium]